MKLPTWTQLIPAFYLICIGILFIWVGGIIVSQSEPYQPIDMNNNYMLNNLSVIIGN